MKTFIVCLLVGLAVATTPSTHNAWKKNTEYHYRVNARTLAALHDVADQYTGILVRADLKINQKNSGVLSGRVANSEYAEIHVNLPQGWESEIPQEQLHYKPLPMSDKPFEITIENGVVKQVVVNKDMPNWESNVIRSLVSQIQIDMQGENLMASRFNQEPEAGEFSANYKTMEDTVTGKCETLYDVFQLPEHVLQNRPQIAPLPHLKGEGQIIGIVKTKNYSNCEQTVEYHFGLPHMHAKNIYDHLGQFLSKSSLSLVVISGNWNRYTIQSSVTTNKIIVSPTIYGKQQGMVVSRVNITLKAVSNANEEPAELESPISIGNLVYSYNSPFASENVARQYDEEEARKSNKYESEYSGSSEERREHEKRHRNSRSISNKISAGKWGREDISASASNENDNHYVTGDYQPMPSLQQAPENPLLPYFIAMKGRSIKSAINPVEAVVKVARKLVEGIQRPNEIQNEQTLSRFTILSDFITIMDAKQVKEASQQLWQAQQQNPEPVDQLAWKALRDAVAQAGTGPALAAIKEWIQTKKIRGEEAAQVLAALPHSASHPTEEYVRALYELSTSQQVKSQQNLYETAILSFSELVRKAFVDYDESQSRYSQKTFGNLASETEKHAFVTKEYIPYLAQQLEESVQNGDDRKTQMYIRALGNVAHAQILAVYKPYLEGDRKISQFQRVLMVLSMDQLTKTYRKEARAVLYKIYANTGDENEIRVAAIYQLMRTMPPASMLQRMAEYTHVEPSMHVRSAIKSSIESVAQLKEEYSQFASNAREAVKLLRPEEHSIYHAQNLLSHYVIEHMKLSYKQTVHTMSPTDNLANNFFYYSLRLKESELSRQHIHLQAMVSSIQSLVKIFDDAFAPEGNNRQQQSLQSNQAAAQWVEKIAKLLNIQMDKQKKFEATVLVKLLGADRFFAFDERTVKDWFNIKLSNTLEPLRAGQRFNYTKLYNSDKITVSVPTEMSFPFVFTLNKPTLINVGGQVQAAEIKSPLEFNFNSEIEIVLAQKTQSKIGFVTPHDNHMYVAGFEQDYQLHLPINAKIGMDKNRRLNVQLGQLRPDQNENIYHYSSWPYTSKVNVLDLQPTRGQKNTHILHRDNHNQYEKVYGQENGIAYRVKFQSEETIIDEHTMRKQIEKYGVLAPIYDNSIIHRNINVDYASDLSSAQHVKVAMGVKDIDQKYAANQMQKSNNAEQQQYTPKVSAAELEKHQSRQNEFAKVVSHNFQNPSGQVWDISVQFPGEKQLSYVATFAYAKNIPENKLRHLLYLSKAGKEEQNNFQIYFNANTKATQSPALNFIQALRADSYLKSDVQINYGQRFDSAENAQINIQVKLEKSEERRQALQKSPMAQLCAREMEQNQYQQYACANLTSEASRMDRAHFNVKYNQVGPAVRNMTEKLYSFAKYLGYDYIEENSVNATGSGNAQQIQLHAEIEPEHLRTMNVSIHTPKTDVYFKNIRLNRPARSLVAFRPDANPMRNLQAMMTARVEPETTAVLDSNAVTTFNNRSYPISLGNCYHVFLHARTSYRRDMEYTLLVRDSLKHNMKELNIVYGRDNKFQQIQLLPNDEQKEHSREHPAALIYVNEQQINIPMGEHSYIVKDFDDKEWASIYIQTNGEIKLHFRNDMTVYYDGVRVKVQLAEKYTSQVRGLAGTNNNEAFIDFMAPRNCLLQDPRHFAASYAVADETCQGPAKEQQRAAQAAYCAERKTLYTNVVSQRDAHNHEQKSKCSTRHQTRYTVEDGGKTICFTTRALPVCAKGCKNNKTVEKTIEVHCLKRTSTVNLYKQQIDKGANPDFSDKPVTKTIRIKVPSNCSA